MKAELTFKPTGELVYTAPGKRARQLDMTRTRITHGEMWSDRMPVYTVRLHDLSDQALVELAMLRDFFRKELHSEIQVDFPEPDHPYPYF